MLDKPALPVPAMSEDVTAILEGPTRLAATFVTRSCAPGATNTAPLPSVAVADDSWLNPPNKLVPPV